MTLHHRTARSTATTWAHVDAYHAGQRTAIVDGEVTQAWLGVDPTAYVEWCHDLFPWTRGAEVAVRIIHRQELTVVPDRRTNR